MPETVGTPVFAERLAEVLDKEPFYYQLLVSTEPTRRMADIIESLALEGDPEQPETVLALFQELGVGLPREEMEQWLGRLREAARRVFQPQHSGTTATVTGKILSLVYADPNLYELVAAAEPGYGLLEIVESLALDVNANEVEPAMQLMHQLSATTP